MNRLKIRKNPLIFQPWQNNTWTIDAKYLVISFTYLLFASFIFLFNKHFFYFTGYGYAEFSYFLDFLFLCFLVVIMDKVLEKPQWVPKITDITITFGTMFLIAILTQAVQLTPFPTIDWLLGKYELLPLEKTVMWTRHHPYVELALKDIYNLLVYAMIYCPVINILFGERLATHHYCRFILISSLIGFSVYFIFPSCGPASYYHSDWFFKEQHANHIKFWLIHHGQFPNSPDGGLIALPSFHVIWAWACCRIFSTMPKFIYYTFFSYFFLTCISCFFLGWHYSIDILGSFVVIYLTEKYLAKV